MRTTVPDVTPEGKYTTTQTYRALGISYNTLKSYVERGLISPRQGRVKRFFRGSEIIRFWKEV